MHRRLACLAVALLVSGCSFSGLGPPPNYGYVVITAGGVGLRSGVRRRAARISISGSMPPARRSRPRT